jgi:hypothetical protein
MCTVQREVYLRLCEKYVFQSVNLHETQIAKFHFVNASCIEYYQIDIKCIKYEQNFIYDTKQSMVFTASSATKLITAE